MTAYTGGQQPPKGSPLPTPSGLIETPGSWTIRPDPRPLTWGTVLEPVKSGLITAAAAPSGSTPPTTGQIWPRGNRQ